MEFERRYSALQAKDTRFDGWFITAVTSTGIYCRPSCPARTPKPENVRFFATAAAAHAAGFRACKRCRPDAAPGSPEWNVRADVVARAMRMIADGVVDRDGVGGLARALGYTERHLNRLLVAEVGAAPLALARAQRAQTARILLETTDLPATQVAFAAGFSSVRQFNETVQAIFATTPTGLRARADRRVPTEPGAVALRLPFRSPFAAEPLFAFLAARAVPGVEEGNPERYARTLSLPHGPGIVEIDASTVGEGWLRCVLRLEDLRDLTTAVQRCRRLLDLDADAMAVVEHLGTDRILGRRARRAPGMRIPGHVDGHELAARAVLGQQVSVARASTIAGVLTERYGKPLASPSGGLTHLFPSAATLAALSPADLPVPAARARALTGLCAALVDGKIALDPGADRGETEQRMLALPGIGPWTASYARMRALGDPDVFMPTDLGVIRGLRLLGFEGSAPDAERLSNAWRPWRSYALQYVWNMEEK